jgi:hypothetical protein
MQNLSLNSLPHVNFNQGASSLPACYRFVIDSTEIFYFAPIHF